MSLHLPSPPSFTYDLLAQAMSRLSTAAGAAAQVTQVEDPSQLNCSLPHRVYSLGSNDIAQGKKLRRARLVAWRFLILYGQKIIAAIELGCDARGGTLRFSSLDTGPFAQGTHQAVMQAEESEAVKAGSYELRVLKAPSVHVMALWLKNLGDGEDIVIPITPEAPGQRVSFSPASGGGPPVSNAPDSFLEGLRPAANANRGFDSTPQVTPDDSGGGPEGGQPSAPPPPAPAPAPTPAPTAARWSLVFQRQAFIKNYANMTARTWVDDQYLQRLLARPVESLAEAGLAVIPGAVVRVIQHKLTGMGKIEDQVDAWIEGNRTGLYDLFLPLRPDDVDLSPGGGGVESAEGGASCCCSPCCCCT